ncbi:MAG: glycosyltransferase family protein [Rickettsiales bacterium]
MRTLVLTKIYPHRASYYDDWLDAFSKPPFNADSFNIMQMGAAKKLASVIDDYELVVLLHACTADALGNIDALSSVLQNRKNKLLVLVGNEGNSPDSPLGKKIAFLQKIDADYIATYLLKETAEWLYSDCRGKVIAMPHALNPEAFKPEMALAQRPIDLGTRTFRYLPYIGDRDRTRIMEYFEERNFNPPLKLDFSTSDRFDRTGWSAFLNSCRGTVSTEAGSHYMDKDDALVIAIRQHVLKGRKGVTLSGQSAIWRLGSRLPYPVKAMIHKLMRRGPITHAAVADEKLDYDEIIEMFFKNAEKCPHYSKVLSSRHFDAIGTKTVQIMFPGRFNDIFKADEHYIALAPDFSNIDEVIEKFRDDSFVKNMTDKTYEFVMDAHTYAHRMDQLASLLR